MSRFLALLASCAALLLLGGCAGHRYEYRYVPGKTATLENGMAIAPPGAPEPVLAAIAAGNRIAGLPYRYGGGRVAGVDTGYDCSGAMSYVLRGAGLMRGSTTSRGFRSFGEPGEGEWITIFARKGHVFLSVAGLRFDTGYTSGPEGPQWTTRSRPAPGSVLRHPRGL